MSKTKTLIEKMTSLAIPFEHYKLPHEVAEEICSVQPIDPIFMGFNVTSSPIPAPDITKAIKAAREFEDKIHNPYAAEIIENGIDIPTEYPLRIVNRFTKNDDGTVKINQKLLPKHWEPKGEYIEVFSGKDHTYVEKIIPRSEMKQHILDGWSITRLTKVSRSMVYKKWIHAIIAMEK